ncbi:methyl-accepting chemotaxis protein WspA [Roseomonas rosea]|uniref:Methyl-accepting chemotaxis protein WspA n=1 Tax=Muricoccus roseus TaxID=198092 RepID=A0A1M6PDS8_9PROT|nr:methyl-accepting chemotaxis protein [Roseomonas rosea]SHK06115.1 methyl-accepting chemotaxis protein WspA [Roseomonas rosea]
MDRSRSGGFGGSSLPAGGAPEGAEPRRQAEGQGRAGARGAAGHLPVRWLITLSFVVVIALMMAMGAIGYLRLAEIEREAELVERETTPGLYVSSQLTLAWAQRFAMIEGHVLLDGQAERQELEARMQANRASIETLSRLYEGLHADQSDREQLAALKAQEPAFVAAEAEVLRFSREDRDDEARAALTGRLLPANRNFQAALVALMEVNKTEADKATRQIVASSDAAQLGMSLTLAVAVLLAAICGYFLLRAITLPLGRLVEAAELMREGDFSRRVVITRRDEFGVLARAFNRMIDDLTALIGQVQRSSIQVSTSITETAATSRQQQATANEIAATTSEIGATSREISATSKELVRTMEDVAAVSDHAASMAGEGRAGLARMEEILGQVAAAAGSINAKLGVLNEKAGNINQVVTTITKVADQTNLLSLNAAIEAEKAGEYGRGFGVVATEIRRLADQTAVATTDIEQMVKDIQSAVSAGVMGMDKFSEEVRRGVLEAQAVGGQLSNVIEQVQGLAPRFENVSEGMQAQAVGAGQISDALSQLGEAVTQTVESLQQSSQAIDELNQVAGGLRGSISRFRLQS